MKKHSAYCDADYQREATIGTSDAEENPLTRIAEVIEASTAEFTAECYELHHPPPLGSLVRASDGALAIYGVVCEATTASIDPGRRPIARGREASHEEDIYRDNPQLARLLRTSFRALVVGHGEGRVGLPPRPARVHSFVSLCQAEEVERLTRSLDFLTLLLPAGDEVVAACLRAASAAHPDGRAFLVAAGKELAVLLSGEPSRLNAILRRLRP